MSTNNPTDSEHANATVALDFYLPATPRLTNERSRLERALERLTAAGRF